MANETAKIEILIKATEKGFDNVIKKFEKLQDTLKKVSTESGVGSFSKIDQGLKSIDGNLKILNNNLTKTAEGFKLAEKSAGSFVNRLSMQWNLKSFISDIEQMIAVQLRWYAAQPLVAGILTALSAPVKLLKEGFSQNIEIDKYTGMLNRYAAMEGQTSTATREATDEIIQQAKILSVQLPVAFDHIMTSADRLMAAGLNIDTVRDSLKSFSKLEVAFPEIEMEKFTTSMVGFLNAYRDQPGMKNMANDAERLAVILDKVTMLLAKSVLAPKDTTAVIQYLGQIGSVAGFSIDQLMAMSALVTNLGAKANVSARSLRGFLQSLTTEKASKALEDLGIKLDRNKTIADQFDTVMTQLQQKLAGGSTQMALGSLQALTNITSTERLNPLLAMIQHWDEYKKLLDASTNSMGALDGASKAMSDTLPGMIERFKNLWKMISSTTTQTDDLKDGLEGLMVISKGLGVIIISLFGAFSAFMGLLKSLANVVFMITDGFATLYKMSSLFREGNLKGAIDEWGKYKDRVNETVKSLEESRKKRLEFQARGLEVLFGEYGINERGKYVGKTPTSTATGTKTPPPELEKTSGLTAYTSAIRQLAKVELELQKEQNNYNLQLLENLLSAKLIDEQEYHTRKSELIKEGGILEQQEIEEGYEETKDALEKELAGAKDNTKRKAILVRLETEEKKKNLALIKSINKQVLDEEKNRIAQEQLAMRNRLSTAEFVATYEKKEQADLKDSEITNINEKVKKNQYLYEQGLINAKTYYDAIEALSKETVNAELKDIDRRYEINKKNLEAQLAEQIAGSEKYQEIQNNIATLWQEWENERSSAIRKGGTTELEDLLTRLSTPEGVFSNASGWWEGFLSVSNYSLKKLEKEWTNTAENINKIWTSMAENLADTFEEFFNDVMEGNIDSLYDYFSNFVKAVMKQLNAIAAKEIAVAAVSGISTGVSALVGLVAHGGGLIKAYHGGGLVAPAFHGGGLNSDERMAVLLTKERVLDREQTTMMDNMYNRVMSGNYGKNNIEFNIINQSSSNVTAEHKETTTSLEKTVISIVLKDMNSNGNIYKAVKGVKR